MVGFQDALAAWLAFLLSLGIDMRAQVNPPATEQQIAAVEAAIGYEFPEDLRQLYLFANGQRDTLEMAERPGVTGAGPFFGRYDFLSLEQALDQYRVWLGIYEDEGENFSSVYNWTRARAGDPVHGDYWRPGWFPFSHDSAGNSYAVDLSPAPGGTYGQVILIGRDEDERRVLAPSLGAFLAQSARRRPPVEQREGAWIGFDMEAGS